MNTSTKQMTHQKGSDNLLSILQEFPPDSNMLGFSRVHFTRYTLRRMPWRRAPAGTVTPQSGVTRGQGISRIIPTTQMPPAKPETFHNHPPPYGTAPSQVSVMIRPSVSNRARTTAGPIRASATRCSPPSFRE